MRPGEGKSATNDMALKNGIAGDPALIHKANPANPSPGPAESPSKPIGNCVGRKCLAQSTNHFERIPAMMPHETPANQNIDCMILFELALNNIMAGKTTLIQKMGI